MKRLLATGVVVILTGAVCAAPPVPAGTRPDAFAFVRSAVAVGLIEDGMTPALAAELATRDDFVMKCGLCEPTRNALRAHGKLKAAPAAEVGKGLSVELMARLKSDTAATRRLALRDLVQVYTEREYARRDLTAAQRTELQKESEEMRERAMGGLKPGQKFCPSCDGACRLPPKL